MGTARSGRVVLAVLMILLTTGCSARAETEDKRGVAMPAFNRDGYGSEQADTYLAEIRAAGANWVQIVPIWYQADVAAADIRATDKTPSDASVISVIERAAGLGLKVMLKPQVDVSDGAWRGNIVPRDRAAWFASYTAFIDHYAELAAATRVAQFVAGTELAGLSADRAAWSPVLDGVRERYRGPVLYAANWNEYQQVAFWDLVDLVGIDAYFPLSSQPTTATSVLVEHWQPIRDELARFSADTGRRILFTEAGYTTQRGTTSAPWMVSVSPEPDQAEQAAAYDALLQVFPGQPWWVGVHWWAWNEPGGNNLDAPLGYTPRGKLAEQVLRRHWAS